MSNKALVYPAPGGKLTLQDRHVPTAGNDQIVVRNHALALNPADYKLLDVPDFWKQLGIKTWPVVQGSDAAGVVHAIGPNVTAFKPGDRVMVFTTGNLSNNADKGAYQEYSLVDAILAAHLPDDIPLAGGATLPVSILTAAGALRDVGIELPKTASSPGTANGALLIWSGASSAGSSMIQFAKAAGATVFTTASPKHHAYVRELGAEVVLDYKSPTIVEDLQHELSNRGLKLLGAIDAVSADLPGTAKVFSELGGGHLMTMVPWEMSCPHASPPKNVKHSWSGAHIAMKDNKYTAHVMHELAEGWLKTKLLRPHKIQLIPNGLSGIGAGLDILRNGVSGVKLVVEV